MNEEIIKHLWALRKVNEALIAVLKTAIFVLKNKDELSGERRKSLIESLERLIAYVFVDGLNFNLELVRQGSSPYYSKYGLSEKYDHEFREAERYARKQKLNIWGDPKLTKRYLRLKSKWGQYRTQTNK